MPGLTRAEAPTLLERNRSIHRMLVDGVGVEYRRPDVVLYVNGLPLAVIELKDAADEDATVWAASPGDDGGQGEELSKALALAVPHEEALRIRVGDARSASTRVSQRR